MTTPTVVLLSPAGVTNYTGQSGTAYTADSYGRFTINAGDIKAALDAGFIYAPSPVKYYYAASPLAASATRIVSSVAATNGTLTIAAQPDCPRPIQFVFAPGTTAVTAGTLTLVYVATNGQTVTDVLSLVTPLSTSATLASTQGVASLTSATIAGLTGGTSPGIEGGVTASIALPGDPLAQDFVVFKEIVDGLNETVGTVVAASGFIAPTTAPNGTHSYSFGYTYISQV